MGNSKIYIFGVLCIFVLLYGAAGLTSVNPGEVGILIKVVGVDRGMQEETLGVGMRWVDPLMYDVEIYDTRFKQYEIPEIDSGTADGQSVKVDLSIQLGLLASAVPDLHSTVGRDYYDQIVYPAIRSTVRNKTATQLSDKVYTGEGRTVIQNEIQETLVHKLDPLGILVETNLRSIGFTNQDFIRTLEDKAKAAQQVTIAERNAERTEQEAIAVKNKAEGEKQKSIKEAEGERERLRLLGEGERLQKEEQAKGILAIAKAEAEGNRLQVLAYGSGKTYASVRWAETLGPNVKVLGYPLGAEGTTGLFNLNGILGDALTVKE